jgi:hypothetical protein
MASDALDNLLKTFILQKNRDSNVFPTLDSNASPTSDSSRGIGIFVDKFAKNFDGVDNIAKNLITNKIGTNVFGPYGMLASTVLDGLGSFMGNFKGFEETPIDQFNLSNFAGYTGGGGMADRQDKFGYNIVSAFGDYNKFAREQAAKEKAAGYTGYSGNYYTDIANKQNQFTNYGGGNPRDYDQPPTTPEINLSALYDDLGQSSSGGDSSDGGSGGSSDNWGGGFDSDQATL